MSNLVSIEVFLADLESELPSCPCPVIERRLRETIIETCERANLWRWQHPELPVISGVSEYTLLTPTADSQIHSVLRVTLEGRALNVDAAGFSIPERGTIRLSQVPIRSSSPLNLPDEQRGHKGLEMLLTCKPTRDALEVPEFFTGDYHNLIITGTLAKSWAMTARAWSNPEMAAQYNYRFEFDLAQARQGIDRGFVTASQRIRPRHFAASTRRGA